MQIKIPDTPESAAAIARARHSFFVNDEAPVDLLPNHVLDSWQRCRALGVNSASDPQLEPISAPDIRQQLDRDQPLLRAAEQEFRMLSQEFRDTGHLVFLADDQGYMLSAGGDIANAGHILRHAQQGVNLSEANFGTTAPATALASRRPVAVHRGQHFLARMEAMECVAVPIFQPTGDVIGALGVSAEHCALMPGVMDLVQNSMAHVERCLLQAMPSSLVLHVHPRLECLGTSQEGLIAISDAHEVLGLNTIAARLLGLHQHEALSRGLEDFIDTPLDARASRSGQTLLLRARTRLGLYARLERTTDFRRLPSRRVAMQEFAQAQNRSAASLLEPFTDQESKVLHYLEQGLRNQDISKRLFVSENTVKFHLKNIFSKLAVRSRAQAVAVARQCGIIH